MVATSTIWTAGNGSPVPGCDGPQGITLSNPITVDLTVYRGDSGRFTVTVSLPDGDPLDVSTATWDCDIRTTVDTATVLATMTVTPVVDSPQAVEVVLTAAESAGLTSDGVWDLQMTLDGETQTLLRGAVHVVKDVSRPAVP